MRSNAPFDPDAPLEIANRSLQSGAPVELTTCAGRKVRGPVQDIRMFPHVVVGGSAFPLSAVRSIEEVADAG